MSDLLLVLLLGAGPLWIALRPGVGGEAAGEAVGRTAGPGSISRRRAARRAGAVALLMGGVALLQIVLGGDRMDRFRLTLLGYRFGGETAGEVGVVLGGDYGSADVHVPGSGEASVARLRLRAQGPGEPSPRGPRAGRSEGARSATTAVVRAEEDGTGLVAVRGPDERDWRLLGARPLGPGDTVVVRMPQATIRLVADGVGGIRQTGSGGGGAAAPVAELGDAAADGGGAGSSAGSGTRGRVTLPPHPRSGVRAWLLARLGLPRRPSPWRITYPLADVVAALEGTEDAPTPLSSFFFFGEPEAAAGGGSGRTGAGAAGSGGGGRRLLPGPFRRRLMVVDLDSEVEIRSGGALPGSPSPARSLHEASLETGSELLVAGLPFRDYPDLDLESPERGGIRPLASFRIEVAPGHLDVHPARPEVVLTRPPPGDAGTWTLRLAHARNPAARDAVVLTSPSERFAPLAEAVLELPTDPVDGTVRVRAPEGRATWELGEPFPLGESGSRSLLLRVDGQGMTLRLGLLLALLVALGAGAFFLRPGAAPVFPLALAGFGLALLRLLLAVGGHLDPPYLQEGYRLGLWILPVVPWTIVGLWEAGAALARHGWEDGPLPAPAAYGLFLAGAGFLGFGLFEGARRLVAVAVPAALFALVVACLRRTRSDASDSLPGQPPRQPASAPAGGSRLPAGGSRAGDPSEAARSVPEAAPSAADAGDALVHRWRRLLAWTADAWDTFRAAAVRLSGRAGNVVGRRWRGLGFPGLLAGLVLLAGRTAFAVAGFQEALLSRPRVSFALAYTPVALLLLAAVVVLHDRRVREATRERVPRALFRGALDVVLFCLLAFAGAALVASDFGIALVGLPGVFVALLLVGARWARTVPGAGRYALALMAAPLVLFAAVQTTPRLASGVWELGVIQEDVRMREWNRNQLLLLERADFETLRFIGQRRSEALAVMRETMRAYTRGNWGGHGFLQGEISAEIAETAAREHTVGAMLAAQWGLAGVLALLLLLAAHLSPVFGLRGGGLRLEPGAAALCVLLPFAVLVLLGSLAPRAAVTPLTAAVGVGALAVAVWWAYLREDGTGPGAEPAEGARAPAAPDAGEPPPLRVPGLAAALLLLTVVFGSLYMVLANYGLVFFTGKNVYLLGLDSVSDTLEYLSLAGLAAGFLGWRRPWGAGEARPVPEGREAAPPPGPGNEGDGNGSHPPGTSPDGRPPPSDREALPRGREAGSPPPRSGSPGPGRPAVRLRRLPFVLLGLGGILVLLETARPEPRGYWAPDGFVSVADSLIRVGRLELLPRLEADSIRPAFGSDSAAIRFFNESYLRGDVRTFNTDPRAPRTPFLVRDGVLRGVDSTYHRIELPFGPAVRWLGDLRLTNRTPVTVLAGSEGARLELRHPRSADDTRPVRVRLPARDAAAGGAHFELLAPDGVEVLARLFYVGDAPVLEDARDRGEETEIRLSGVGTERGFRYLLRGGDWIHIRRPGRTAADGAAGTGTGTGRTGMAVTFLVRRDAAARTLSFVRERNERISRVHTAGPYEDLSEHVGQALDLALASEGRVRELVARDLELTLDRELTGALDTLVLGSALCAAGDLDRPRSVSLLVMDAFSGRIRAMPSCPDAGELARWEPLPRRSRVRLLRNQNLVDHPIGSAGKPFWAAAVTTAQPNFLDLTIPGHETERHQALLGCPLPSPYRDFPHPGRVDFERFLRSSCNRYLVEMATATFAVREDPARPSRCRGELSAGEFVDCLRGPDPGGPGSTGVGSLDSPGSLDDPRSADGPGAEDPRAARFSVCGREISLVLSDEMEGVETGCRLSGVRAAFDGTLPLEDVTGARTLSREMPGASRGDTTSAGARFRLGRYRADVWRELFRAFERAGSREVSRTALRFASVVPEATNLELNTVEELRRDWVNLLLGGDESRWSNLELAEATARLMTGTDVRATLVSRFADSLDAEAPAAERFAPLGPESLHPGARRRVLHALELVWRDGTAAGLAPQLRRLSERTAALGYELYAFAKTGTANVQKPVPSPALRTLHDLASAGEIGWIGDSLAILDGPEARRLTPAYRRSLTRRYLAPVAADPGRFTVSPDATIGHPVTLTPAGRPVVPLRNDALEDREGGVLLLGLLAVPRESGRERAARLRDWITACPDMDPALRRGILEVPPVELLDPEASVGLTAAFYADDLPPEGSVGSQVAVGLARETLDEIGAYLLAEVARKAR